MRPTTYANPRSAGASAHAIATRILDSGELDDPPERSITRYDALTVALRAALIHGLGDWGYKVLNELVLRTRPDDWSEGRPFAFMRNHTLALALDTSEQQISRTITLLEKAGFVRRTLQTSGHRWARRHYDGGGSVLAGEGIELTPLIDRHDEWRSVIAERAAIDEALRAEATHITGLRVEAERIVNELRAHAAEDDRLREIDSALAALFRRNSLRTSRGLRALSETARAELEHAVRGLLIRLQTLQADLKVRTELHIETTAVAPPSTHYNRHIKDSYYSTARTTENPSNTSPELPEEVRLKGGGRGPHALAPDELLAAAPTFASLLPLDRREATHVIEKALSTIPMLRIDARMWRRACDAMDEYRAAMLVAYVLEAASESGPRGLRDPANTGGYFRRCVEKAERGELRHDVSLRARLRRKAPRPPRPPQYVAAPPPDLDDDLI